MPFAEVSNTPRRSAPPHVLIVDDNELVLELADRILHAAGFSTYATADPANGIDIAMTQEFDVVLLDINMPVISGVEVIERIKGADGPNRHTPVIAFTAAPATRHDALLNEHRFDAVVAKPVIASDLLLTIWQLVA